MTKISRESGRGNETGRKRTRGQRGRRPDRRPLGETGTETTRESGIVTGTRIATESVRETDLGAPGEGQNVCHDSHPSLQRTTFTRNIYFTCRSRSPRRQRSPHRPRDPEARRREREDRREREEKESLKEQEEHEERLRNRKQRDRDKAYRDVSGVGGSVRV